MKVLESNLKTLREFTPMNIQEKKEITLALTPFFNHENLPWMNEEYRDGNWT